MPNPETLPTPCVSKPSLWRRFLDLEGSPYSLAAGLAIGVFFGITPFWGLKTFLTLSVAGIFRANLLAAVLALTAQDFLTPLVPVMLRMQYTIGYWLLSHPHQFPPALEMRDFSPTHFFHWNVFLDTGFPILLGSLTWAIPATGVTYFVAWKLLQRRQSRNMQHGVGKE